MTAAESGEHRTTPSTRATPDMSGLTRIDGVVILSGPALRFVLRCVLIVVHVGRASRLPTQTVKALACELNEAVSAAGQSVMRSPAISKAVAVDQRPTVPIAEAAERLGISVRHARRLAPKLGGQRIAGSWFVDELALRQHTEGKT
jgi:hypothetical protein